MFLHPPSVVNPLAFPHPADFIAFAQFGAVVNTAEAFLATLTLTGAREGSFDLVARRFASRGLTPLFTAPGDSVNRYDFASNEALVITVTCGGDACEMASPNPIEPEPSPLPTRAVVLEEGDLLLPIESRIFHFDPKTRVRTLVSSDGLLEFPADIEVDANGDILWVDIFGGIIRVDPESGAQSVLLPGTDLRLMASGIDATANILVANAPLGGPAEILRIDRQTGATTIISSGGQLESPVDIAVNAAGEIFVAQRASIQVLRIDPDSGIQSIVASGGILRSPRSIAIDANGDLLVAEYRVPPEHYRAVIRIDPTTGGQTLVSSGGFFFDMRGIAV